MRGSISVSSLCIHVFRLSTKKQKVKGRHSELMAVLFNMFRDRKTL